MKSILTSLLLTIALHTQAQGRYCTNYDDYIAGNWIELPELTFTRSKKPKKNPAAADIIFTTKDKTTDEELDNKAVFIQCGDSLFINLREFRLGHAFFTNHYALAYPLHTAFLSIKDPYAFCSFTESLTYAVFSTT